MAREAPLTPEMDKRRWLIAAGVVALVAVVIGLVLRAVLPRFGLPTFGLVSVDDPGPRPKFQMPFTCGQSWRLSTYNGHHPDDMKIDMFRWDGGKTRGSDVVATAPGEVVRLGSPGTVTIDHGGRWYTVSIHMDNIVVSEGQTVRQGEVIGHVGSVGTKAAHLHYEQRNDSDGDGRATKAEMVHPVIQGTKYQLRPQQKKWPVIKSTNACSSKAVSR